MKADIAYAPVQASVTIMPICSSNLRTTDRIAALSSYSNSCCPVIMASYNGEYSTTVEAVPANSVSTIGRHKRIVVPLPIML